MARSLTPARRRAQPGSRVVVARAVVALAVTGTLAFAPVPAAAQPGPSTSAQAADLIAARARDLEVLTEHFNQAREELAATQKAADRAAKELASAQAALTEARSRVREVARSAYTGDQLGPLQAMLTSGSADELLDRVGTLRAIASHNDGVLGSADQANSDAEKARKAAEDVAARARTQVDRVSAQKSDLNAQIAVYQAEYDRLHAAEQRASRAAAERRARDRAAAAKAAAAHAAAAPAAPARAATVSPSAPAAPAAPAPVPPPAPVAGGSGAAAVAVRTALAQVGDPYVWAAAGPDAFDCSGLMQYAYAAAGISLPHSSAMQSTMGTPVSRSELRPGDLVFFYSPVSHVGMYIGNGQMVHASTSGQPVKVAPLDYMPSYNSARRIAG